MYSALNLSKYIVSKCIRDRAPISNLQLQKILYYIQKAFLDNENMAFDDAIEAWQFGPVVPESYYYFCGFGAMPISFFYEDYNINSKDAEIIDRIIEQKRILDPWTMVSETHKPNGAWSQVYKNGEGNHQIIPINLIKTAG